MSLLQLEKVKSYTMSFQSNNFTRRERDNGLGGNLAKAPTTCIIWISNCFGHHSLRQVYGLSWPRKVHWRKWQRCRFSKKIWSGPRDIWTTTPLHNIYSLLCLPVNVSEPNSGGFSFFLLWGARSCVLYSRVLTATNGISLLPELLFVCEQQRQRSTPAAAAAQDRSGH